MDTTFREALMMRRSYYELSDSGVPDDCRIVEILDFAVRYVPSAFDSRSTRIVLLLRDAHSRLWNIVKDVLRERVPPHAFGKTERKIDRSFAAGYGTVLFFEDETVVADMCRKFPTYAENFPKWSEQTSAMHQLAVWTMLEEAGMGASLQHYNPLIDRRVRQQWQLPESWRLIAQMPFGKALDTPAEKISEPVGILTFDE